MDNITHSLIGVLLGQALGPREGSRRGAMWTGVIASNFPDIDLIMRPLFEDAKLGYLVHHRGYTHTLAAALPLALLAVAAGVVLDRESRAAKARLFAVALVSVVLHMGADFWNNYGVHPFWPIDNHWYYGDIIFIIEPLIWLGLIPFAYRATKSRLLRGLWGGLEVAMLGLVWTLGGIPLATRILATVWAGLVAGAQYRVEKGAAPPRWRATGPPLVALGLALALFTIGSQVAEGALRRELEAHAPGERVLDIALTPSPGTPWCWQAIVLSRTGATAEGSETAAGNGRYFARQAQVSLLPAFSTPAACDAGFRGGTTRTAPSVASLLPPTGQIQWTAEFQGAVAELRAYAKASCEVGALLRFTRAPFWKREGETLVAGDLRYDFEPELGFSEIQTSLDRPSPAACELLAPWIPDVAREFL